MKSTISLVETNAQKRSEVYNDAWFDKGTSSKPYHFEGEIRRADQQYLTDGLLTNQVGVTYRPEKPTSARPITHIGQPRVNQINAIQAAFGLTTQALADILNISRQQLYKWFDASTSFNLHDESRKRLSAVEKLASLWLEHSQMPLSSVAHQALENGQTVLDLLKAKNLDEKVVLKAFNQLAQATKKLPKSRSQLMAEAGFTRRPSAKTLPADE
jgi:DNA-binding transcriptional regulator YiaG